MSFFDVLMVLFLAAAIGVAVAAMRWTRKRDAVPEKTIWMRMPDGSEVKRKVPASKCVEPPTCGSCENFDLAAGQKIQRDHPAFHAATQHIPPWRMGAPHDEDGNPLTAPDVGTLKTSWDEIGLCTVPDDAGARELVSSRCTECPKNAYSRKQVAK